MALAAGVTWACTPDGGAPTTSAGELAPLERLEIDASWLRRPSEPEPLSLPTTAVALDSPDAILVPVAHPALGRPLAKAVLPPAARQEQRVSKTSFATPPAPPKREPGIPFSRGAAQPQAPQVVLIPPMPPMPPMPRAVESIPPPASTSSAHPVSTASSF
jgi:hypothetical protein